MAGRPSKSVKVLRMEDKSHRTKQELAMRQRAEEANLTGSRMREDPAVRADSAAHKDFVRVRKLLRLIDKDDDLYGAEINLYCMLKSEIDQAAAQRADLIETLSQIRELPRGGIEDEKTFMQMEIQISQQIARCDQIMQSRRKMRLDIENKNLMNIASSLRSVPKNVEKKKNPLMEALGS